MTTQKQIQKVIEIAQEKGWYVSVDDKKMSNISFEFQRFTKYGQDFNFYAEMQQGNIETLIADIKGITRILTQIMKPICGLVKTNMAKKAHPITSRI